MEPVEGMVVYVLVTGSLIWWLVHRLKTRVPDRVRIAEWARQNQFEIVSAQRRWFLTGPYWHLRWPVVYRIRVRDRTGSEKDGWLCVEAPFYFVSMEAKWDRA